jgi:tRNA 5-methylaminomethyl-2-thiouridine biosynthesis bifunctional protein
MVTREASEILVVGAGLAGAACARALARDGHQVVVLEANAQPAMGASGNPLAIVHALFSKDHNRASRWMDQGMVRSMQWLRDLGVVHADCGVLQLAQTAQDDRDWRNPQSALLEYWDKNRVADFLRDHQTPHLYGGLWCAKGGWVVPADFVRRCLEDAADHGARLMFNTALISVDLNRRCVQVANGQDIRFDQIVFCAAQDTDQWIPQAQLTLNAIRGTVTELDCREGFNTASQGVRGLPAVICAQGYATPVVEGRMVVGASYERVGESASPVAEISNHDRLQQISPVLALACRSLPSCDRTSLRSATLDRLPLVGRILDWRQPLAASVSQLHQVPRLSHAWICGGLGSRGVSSVALAAECIAAMMKGDPPLIAPDLAKAVDPVRFALRRHQRR